MDFKSTIVRLKDREATRRDLKDVKATIGYV